MGVAECECTQLGARVGLRSVSPLRMATRINQAAAVFRAEEAGQSLNQVHDGGFTALLSHTIIVIISKRVLCGSYFEFL